jgi:MFS family permease
MGASQASFMAISAAMVQSLAPDEMRGRISGLNQINIGGTMAVVNLVNGFAADAVGAPRVLLVLGMAFILVMAASLMAATLRGVYRGSISLQVRSTA